MDATAPQIGQHWRIKHKDMYGFVSYSNAVISDVSEDGLYVQYRIHGFPCLPVTTESLQWFGTNQKPNWFWRLFGYT